MGRCASSSVPAARAHKQNENTAAGLQTAWPLDASVAPATAFVISSRNVALLALLARLMGGLVGPSSAALSAVLCGLGTLKQSASSSVAVGGAGFITERSRRACSSDSSTTPHATHSVGNVPPVLFHQTLVRRAPSRASASRLLLP